MHPTPPVRVAVVSAALTLGITTAALYATSVLSTLWVSFADGLIAVALTGFALLCGVITVWALRRPRRARAAALLGTVTLAISLWVSSPVDRWAAPLPFDLATLFRHLSHTPLSYGLVAILWAVGAVGLRRSHTRPSPPL